MSSQLKLIKPDKLIKVLPRDCKFFYFDEIDSTNTFLKQQPSSRTIEVCVSEKQLAGRGRFGRDWLSPYAENIYCSIKYPLPVIELNSLSMRLGIVMAEFFKRLLPMHEVNLKWPNDVLLDGKKVAGILVELVGQKGQLHDAVIGFGINVNMKQAPLTNHWSSLTLLTGKIYDRTAILVKLLVDILDSIENEQKLDIEKWNLLDFFYDKKVTVKSHDKILCGQALGVSEDGGLQLLLETGKRHIVYAGEASLHGN